MSEWVGSHLRRAELSQACLVCLFFEFFPPQFTILSELPFPKAQSEGVKGRPWGSQHTEPQEHRRSAGSKKQGACDTSFTHSELKAKVMLQLSPQKI